MNHYAPNNQRAVIAKNVDINNVIWLKGHLMQKNPVAYVYDAKKQGWVKLSK
ncbi:hypothetical protein [Acetilactobacillus jinshanensis]|uniref:hypothetical protein n=1 Tax=Acetilactobacillus jinshanensis TaxID=1720083 RepID=UPI0013A66F56|nr:hypothetical protein [Acetilactobacillus jinshanensis]URL60592.1 hypothetical protein HGK75_00760 [uncultured bacterium]